MENENKVDLCQTCKEQFSTCNAIPMVDALFDNKEDSLNIISCKYYKKESKNE